MWKSGIAAKMAAKCSPDGLLAVQAPDDGPDFDEIVRGERRQRVGVTVVESLEDLPDDCGGSGDVDGAHGVFSRVAWPASVAGSGARPHCRASATDWKSTGVQCSAAKGSPRGPPPLSTVSTATPSGASVLRTACTALTYGRTRDQHVLRVCPWQAAARVAGRPPRGA
jgi:hypothetical protein